ncbi:hypothetical protein Agub_g7261 [Astrephomene gubernaculifera]|uniref:Protein DGCR14 n=1 Tax=Astrephomene gubernaculifera TaxID=47775 RepID=A0AAD3DPU1_9CHLO|nr:hypothetical protein Agub_g7261 [Astrephomene gubernaculifera]
MALVSQGTPSREEELRRLMPPPPPRPPNTVAAPKPKAPTVLDEDTYTQQLEAIIERDYFPELPKMANQLEWLRAVNSGDIREMQRAQRNIALRRAAAAAAATGSTGADRATPGLLPPFQTPGTTGWAAATPGTALLRTPAMTPLVDGSQAAAPVGAPAAATSAVAAAAGRAPPESGMSLDTFLDRYTSEDNASFQAILQEDNRRKRAKVQHHLDRPDPRDPETRQLLLEGPPERPSDEYGSSGQAPMTLLPAPEPPVNCLFYDSSQRPAVPLSAKEVAERALGPPKAINKAGTRLKGAPEAPPPSALSEAIAALDPVAAAAAAVAGLPAGAPAPGGGTVGYAAMATPSFEDVLGTPLMTWGDIESTPLRLGADDMPVALEEEGGGGPSFRVQGLSEREQAAHRLAAAKAGSGTAASRAATARGSTPLLTALRRATGTGAGAGATARGSTPLAVPLSPAARHLAASIKAGKTPRGGGGGGSSGAGVRTAGRGSSSSGRGGLHVPAPKAAAAATAAAARSVALGSGELDKQLRASYCSAAAASLGHGTPTLAAAARGHTPGPPGGVSAGRAAAVGAGVTPGGGAGLRVPTSAAAGGSVRGGVVAGGGAASAGASGGGQSVTDDLLKL